MQRAHDLIDSGIAQHLDTESITADQQFLDFVRIPDRGGQVLQVIVILVGNEQCMILPEIRFLPRPGNVQNRHRRLYLRQ